jgi:type IV pilus assembly protein PilC
VEAGMPLLRGLRLLEEQETQSAFKRVLRRVIAAIEEGASFSEALSQHPKVFDRLYLNMVRAGELGGALEVVLKRLAQFMEKAQRIKGKVLAALYYPAAVITVAMAILVGLLVWVMPRFRDVFSELLGTPRMPAFTQFVLNVSEWMRQHFLLGLLVLAGMVVLPGLLTKTDRGRAMWDRFKLTMPLLGPVFSKAAVARFTRTLGTLLGSGVPILQALTIVKETAGNSVVRQAVEKVHESVKEGETISGPLKSSGVFPAIVVGMVDVGEQTGALPDMLTKIADIYDEEVDNAVMGMTSLLEPVLILFLAVIVGTIVIAMFLPIIHATTQFDNDRSGSGH